MLRRLEVSKTYNPFDLQTSSGVYISVVPTKDSLKVIRLFSQSIDLPLSDEELKEIHCTVMYSKVVPKRLPTLDSSKVYNARAIKLDWWSGHDNDGYLVLRLSSPSLTVLHNEWKSAGCTFSFPTYDPHVTIKNNVGRLPSDFMKTRKQAYRFMGQTLEFTNATLEGLKG